MVLMLPTLIQRYDKNSCHFLIHPIQKRDYCAFVTTYAQKKFYSSQWFLKSPIFSLFPIIKMNTNYVEICRVGNLEADFQQVLLVQFF